MRSLATPGHLLGQCAPFLAVELEVGEIAILLLAHLDHIAANLSQALALHDHVAEAVGPPGDAITSVEKEVLRARADMPRGRHLAERGECAQVTLGDVALGVAQAQENQRAPHVVDCGEQLLGGTTSLASSPSRPLNLDRVLEPLEVHEGVAVALCSQGHLIENDNLAVINNPLMVGQVSTNERPSRHILLSDLLHGGRRLTQSRGHSLNHFHLKALGK